MVDVSQKPFYSYNDALEQLASPINSQADVELLGFTRFFPNRERFIISCKKEWSIDFYNIKKLYTYGLYEKPIKKLGSGFDMWDHLAYSPPEIYLHFQNNLRIAHGLTIIQNHEGYCDEFVFASRPGNSQINNFYLNKKDLFDDFVNNFYRQMTNELKGLESHKFTIPKDSLGSSNRNLAITPRQRECALLISEGYNTKEVAKLLKLSPRTVESYLNSLRDKFEAKNRIHLCSIIKNLV